MDNDIIKYMLRPGQTIQERIEELQLDLQMLDRQRHILELELRYLTDHERQQQPT
jgi:hypothetical protein